MFLLALLLFVSTLGHCASKGSICEYMLTVRTYEGQSDIQYTHIVS
jgi:hypothetical protein